MSRGRFLQSALTNLAWFYYSSRVLEAALSVILLWASCRRLTIRVSTGSYTSPQKTGLIARTLICPVDIIYSSGILHVMTNTHEITTNPQNFREISLTTGRQARSGGEGLPSLCPWSLRWNPRCDGASGCFPLITLLKNEEKQ